VWHESSGVIPAWLREQWQQHGQKSHRPNFLTGGRRWDAIKDAQIARNHTRTNWTGKVKDS